MWLINLLTNEEGWYIPQANQQQHCPLLVFVKDGGIWKTKQWMSNQIRIRARNYTEEIKDNYDMIQSGFRWGFSNFQLKMERCHYKNLYY